MNTSGTILKCPDYQSDSFCSGFELSKVSCLGYRDSVLFIEVSLLQEVHIQGFCTAYIYCMCAIITT